MMGCLSVPGIVHGLIFLAVIAFVVFVIRLILPIILGWLGLAGGVVDQVLRAFVILIAIILVLYFLLWVWGCAHL